MSSKAWDRSLPPVEGEVHGWESHVGYWIDEAESLVELDAIDDDQVAGRLPFGEEINMVQVQVAMTIACHFPISPPFHESAKAGERFFDQRFYSFEHCPADRGFPIEVQRLREDVPNTRATTSCAARKLRCARLF